MSRYCASCGKLLADDAKFCTSCGTPVEQIAAGNRQPAFEQTVSLDTPQAKPDDPLAYRPDPAAAPAEVETTRRMSVTGTSTQQQPASAYAPTSPQAAAPKKSGTKPLIAIVVVLVAIIIALVVFFVIKPFDNAATQTTAEITKPHHDVDADDLKPLGDPNSLYDDDDDDDEDGGAATLSEQNLYRRLGEYYDLLEDLDSQVCACAQAFNGSYLEEDRTTRQNLADVAERTEDTIEQYYDIVEDLDVPASSKNYSSWKDIIALYDDLDHRIDAICDAWEISLKYAKPADHKNEIVAPLSRDNVAGTNDNKYRLDFEERYPGAKPVEVN
ncbi:zinc-ribbon domain-containing protein [Collinsella sp. TM09-10AT]|uniref:zinc-ribbon domain-containing protein n=1 Tax=Collinsella sp. TM09-10AT TaxID=2292343 RepID=UPI000E450752|nr:zinc ribbon domain-containing protein [Collinsella sp. TM09-10AT]RGJ09318.1 zinc ribbon domain-containing protein [Collinsella sp. TM09-10AT]